MKKRLERVNVIIELLRGDRQLNAGQLAEACAVNRRTIYRDIALLRELGVEIRYDQQSSCYSYSPDPEAPHPVSADGLLSTSRSFSAAAPGETPVGPHSDAPGPAGFGNPHLGNPQTGVPRSGLPQRENQEPGDSQSANESLRENKLPMQADAMSLHESVSQYNLKSQPEKVPTIAAGHRDREESGDQEIEDQEEAVRGILSVIDARGWMSLRKRVDHDPFFVTAIPLEMTFDHRGWHLRFAMVNDETLHEWTHRTSPENRDHLRASLMSKSVVLSLDSLVIAKTSSTFQ